MTPNNDELNRILDDALADYLAEPRENLGHRVLARVHEPSRSWRTVWFRPSLALGTLACLLIAAVLFIGLNPKKRVAKVDSVQPTAVSATVAADMKSAVGKPSVPRGAGKKNVRRTATFRSALPKLEQFPSPSPLTENERALLSLVSDPDAIKYLRQHEQKPLTIKSIAIREIKIEPLPSGSK